MTIGQRLVVQILGALCVCLVGPAAQATLANDVPVRLVAPGGVVGDSTPIDASQVATLGGGISSTGSGDISAWMLSGEQISFSGNSILVHVAAGSDDGAGNFTTGYLGSGSEHARYEFDQLAVTGFAITGIQVSAFDGYGNSGTSGLLGTASSYVHLLSANSVSLDLDTLQFRDRGLGGSLNYAELRIDLITTPVPEPATAAFLGLGLVALLVRRRGSRPC